jgi:hypothetical protein
MSRNKISRLPDSFGSLMNLRVRKTESLLGSAFIDAESFDIDPLSMARNRC